MKQSLTTESERQQNNRSHSTTSNVSYVSQAFVDNRESTAVQRQLMAKMTHSPQAIAQRKLSEQMNNSPRMLAQRQHVAKMSGNAVQRVEGEEELMQGKFASIQRVEEEELMQGKFDTAQLEQAPAEKANNTGLPDNLKQGIENLSGMSVDNVKVHYNSLKPAQLNALAYAQGTDIHVGAGQEKHLPHEAWHVVQQAQGRVKPTMQMKDGVSVNDDQVLEHEADVMGARAIYAGVKQTKQESSDLIESDPIGSLQLKGLKVGVLNVVGEDHDESGPRRVQEKWFAHREAKTDRYWQEAEFKERNYSIFKDLFSDKRAPADPFQLRLEMLQERVAFASQQLGSTWFEGTLPPNFGNKLKQTKEAVRLLHASVTVWGQADLASSTYQGMDPDFKAACLDDTPVVLELYRDFLGIGQAVVDAKGKPRHEKITAICAAIGDYDVTFETGIKMEKGLTGAWKAKSVARSNSMHLASNRRSDQDGVWKVGDKHVKDMTKENDRKYNLVSKAEFNSELAAWLKRGGDKEYDEPKDPFAEMPLEARYDMGF